ncbi:TIGR01777 family oxidoreductase [Rathayibacter soli]|uniref:TIGR01777 family oxidoreductase n=1 Tax=Rathayibacter soli TaxID=3144168 RepID=UPI0027E40777|nr:TIGR01777 family oxidoreductase [Glaciibacter superstes]
MGITYSTIVDATIQDVFGWHTRPGAFTRLSPPWQPVSLRAESDNLQDGEALLRLPGGLTWVSRHDPTRYRPPHQFVDTIAAGGLASIPVYTALRWRHTHQFADAGNERTRVTDRVETPLGSHLLRPMFLYRHSQLAGDLAAHRWATENGARPLTIAVTGTSGLVGSALCAFLTSGGHRVIRLVRRQAHGGDERTWNPMKPNAGLLEGIDALVHLAGESIAGRFTPAHKRAIRDSRIAPTRLLCELATTTRPGPRTIVAASAIGYYGADRGDEALTEESPAGESFLANVVADWEAATRPAATAGIRVINIRTGIVQSPRGGTLRLLRPLFALGMGGRIATGQQWLSWIDLDDLIDIYNRALFDTHLSGPVNAVAPQPVRNVEYTRTLARVLTRPALIPVPNLGPQLLLGEEGAHELAQANQKAAPAKLLHVGHHFRQRNVEGSLRHQLGRSKG